MSAIAANFIPLPRRRARAVKITLRRCIVGSAAYGLLLGVGLVFAAATLDTDHSAQDRQLEELSSRTDQQQKQLTALTGQIESNRRILEANRAVSEQPDWSILLLQLPEWLGDDGALRRFSLVRDPEPSTPSTKEAKDAKVPPPKPRGYTLRISALTRSQETPARTVLAMEATGIFDRVKVLETKRETIAKADLVAFEIEGRLGSDGKEAP